jgi:hypothetical protein
MWIRQPGGVAFNNVAAPSGGSDQFNERAATSATKTRIGGQAEEQMKSVSPKPKAQSRPLLLSVFDRSSAKTRKQRQAAMRCWTLD